MLPWFYGRSAQVPIEIQHSFKLVLVLSILSVSVIIYASLFEAPEILQTDGRGSRLR